MAIKLENAQQVLLDAVQPLSWEEIALADSWSRVLAEALVAQTDFPPFDRSPLDGYAVVAADVLGANPGMPALLHQIDNICAGGVPRRPVTPGTAARIMTGAPIPEGATGVVRLEDTESDGESIKILYGAGAEKNICRRGEEMLKGEVLVESGTIVNAGVMGLLAMQGISLPKVFRRPRVALLSTGSEILPVDAPLEAGKIRNSNGYMLSAQVAEVGAQPILLGMTKDDVNEIVSRISCASDCDIVVTTGGASVGDYDLIGEAFKAVGADILFDRVGIKPGMPVLAGVKGDKLYIGLSGNPAAASVSFELLVRPVLAKMGGRKSWRRPGARAIMAASFNKSSSVKRFVWAWCWHEGTGLLVKPLQLQGNGMLKSIITANAMIVIPENSPPLAIGDDVEVLLLQDR